MNAQVVVNEKNIIVGKQVLYADSTAIILTLGQSNSANHGQGTYQCRNKQIYSYFNGVVYKAQEPLIGASGNGCGVWTRLADLLIDHRLYNKVIIIPIGIGSSTVQCWSEGNCNKKLQDALQFIKSDSIRVTHIVWHQGESDNIENTSKDIYKNRLAEVLKQIRSFGITAPFYVCTATYHPSITQKWNGIDTAIQSAQKEFVLENKGVLHGPNTDLIDLAADRYDGVHFSERGLDKFARELLKCFMKN
jgi:lysophospholipase L1-like esterase